LVKQAQGTHRSAKESIKLTTSHRNELEYIAKSVVIAKGAATHVKLNQLDVNQGLKVPVLMSFLMSLFEELIVALPDQDIEFVIEIAHKLLLYIRDPIGWLLSN
jgi:hypothetical protein